MKLIIKRLLSYLPTQLPVGMSQFEAWSDSILELSGEYADRDSMKFAIASMLIHADARHGSLPKHYFVVRLRKSAANQIASQVFQQVKAKQEAATVLAKQQAEATANQGSGSSDGEKTN